MEFPSEYVFEPVDLVGHEDRISSIAISPDGKALASCGRDGSARLWKASEGRPDSVLETRESWAMRARFSPDGRILAVGYSDGAITLWDVASRKASRLLSGHMNPAADLAFLITDICFSPDGRTLASASNDTTIRLWDVATGQTRHLLAKHREGVWKVVFSHDGSRIASVSADQTVRVWDVATGGLSLTLDARRELRFARLVAFSPDDSRLACAGDGEEVRLWDPKSAKQLAVLKTGTSSIHSLIFLPNRNLLLTAGSDRAIKLWNPDTFGQTARLPVGAASGTQCVAISCDDHIIAALENGEIVLRSLIPPLYEEEARIKLDHGEIDALDVAQHQAMLAVGSRDGTVTLVRWKKRAGP